VVSDPSIDELSSVVSVAVFSTAGLPPESVGVSDALLSVAVSSPADTSASAAEDASSYKTLI